MKIAIRFCLFLSSPFLLAHLQAQTQIGGGTCTNAILNGTYYYVWGGYEISGNTSYPYAALGKIIADGQGNVSGRVQGSAGGLLSTVGTFTGTYSVQANCSGTLLIAGPSTAVTLQIVNGGEGFVIAASQQGVVGAVGRAYRSDAAGQCGNSSFSGGYGYILTGVVYVSGSGYVLSAAGNVVSDGRGNLASILGTVNYNGATATENTAGSYSLGSDCSGTAHFGSQSGTGDYAIAVVENGQGILFFDTDTGTTVNGIAQPQFSAPQQAIVNSANFAPQSLSAGSLFSVFGVGLSQQTAQAQTVPLPSILGSTQVLVNGVAAPLFYVAPGQINAQMPLEVPAGTPVSVIVKNAGTTSNTATVNLASAAPGVFAYGNNEAVVQNQNGTLNSPANPAHSGDVLVGYLTGRGPVNPAGPWLTGAASPNGPSQITSSYSVTVGSQQAQVFYLGLAPSEVGVYQVNFKLPALAAGIYPLVITVNGVQSNGPTISIGQ